MFSSQAFDVKRIALSETLKIAGYVVSSEIIRV